MQNIAQARRRGVGKFSTQITSVQEGLGDPLAESRVFTLGPGDQAANGAVNDVGAAPVLEVKAAAPTDAAATAASVSQASQSGAKRFFDILTSLVCLIYAAPLMAVIFLLVRRDGGPAIFVQRRVGRRGETFSCLKFRTMVPEAETALIELLGQNATLRDYWSENRKLPNDPRVTPLGAFLRSKSLDELPQLINVLRGEMSMVGPRPIVPSEQECYGEGFSHYLATRPGLTGLWQVSGRNNLSYAERVKLDVDYVENWSLARDMSILVRTVGAVLSGKGAS